MTDDRRAKAKKMVRKRLGPIFDALYLDAHITRKACEAVEIAVTDLILRLQDERDAEWAKALDPLNVGTDYGKFLADPERAALLLKEQQKLVLSERDAEVKRLVEMVRLCPPTVARNPVGGLTPPAYIATVNAVCDEILRRLGLEGVR